MTDKESALQFLATKGQKCDVSRETVTVPSVEEAALLSASKRLLEVVEGWSGLTTHGTFRGEKSNLRLKDTTEWAAFYVATKRAGEKP